MQSKAKTAEAYLAELPADRRAVLQAVREVILRNLDPDIEECMAYGMICYQVPHRVFPAGYHCDPKQGLPYAGLASQKNYMAVYLGSAYCRLSGGDEPAEDNPYAGWFRAAWAKTGKKLDMGKVCIRFKKLDDLALDVIGEAIRRLPAKVFIKQYLEVQDMMASGASRKSPAKQKPATKKKPAAKKPAAKKK